MTKKWNYEKQLGLPLEFIDCSRKKNYAKFEKSIKKVCPISKPIYKYATRHQLFFRSHKMRHTSFIPDFFNAKENVNSLFVIKYLLTRHDVMPLILHIFQCNLLTFSQCLDHCTVEV